MGIEHPQPILKFEWHWHWHWHRILTAHTQQIQTQIGIKKLFLKDASPQEQRQNAINL